MELIADITYPTASPDEAFSLIVDPAFRAAVCEATHAVDHHVDVDTPADGTATVTVTRRMAADVPEIFKKFVGETVEIVQTERWGPPDERRARVADVTVQVTGQPASMTGTIHLEPSGQGCRGHVDGEVTVSMPFVGKAMEPQLAKGIRTALEEEERTARAWLGQ